MAGKGKGRATYGPSMTDDSWLKSIAGVSDACVELQGFACEYQHKTVDLARC